MSKAVTILICCYNSAQKLPATLYYLSQLKMDDPSAVELLIIDNASTDNTSAIAKEVWNSLNSPFSLTILSEPNPGQSKARVTGIRHAKGDFLLFCDDDNWLASDYLQRILQVMDSNSQIAAVGGYGEACADQPLPVWFEKVEAGYACGPQASASGIITAQRGWLFGAGIVVRKEHLHFALAKFPDTLLAGRAGKSLTSGDDNELCYKLVLCGFDLYYDPALKFRHYMDPSRLSVDYLMRLTKGASLASAKLLPYTELLWPGKSKLFGKEKSIKTFWRLLQHWWQWQTLRKKGIDHLPLKVQKAKSVCRIYFTDLYTIKFASQNRINMAQIKSRLPV